MIPGNEDGSSWSLPASVNSADSGIPGTGTMRRKISQEQLVAIKNTIRKTSLAGMSEISETEVSQKKSGKNFLLRFDDIFQDLKFFFYLSFNTEI